MDSPPAPRQGYTLPVFACAAAIAALQHLQNYAQSERQQRVEDGESPSPASPHPNASTSQRLKPNAKTQHQAVSVDLITPAQTVDIPIEQVAQLNENSALAIARSDPGDNLDLTRHTPIWAWVTWGDQHQKPPILIEGGEGIGRYQSPAFDGSNSNMHTQSTIQIKEGAKAAIYQYATDLLQTNLKRVLLDHRTIKVTLILPEGKTLATRTSNAAFGVVDGLSLLGTSGLSQPLSAPEQLEVFRSNLATQIAQSTEAKRCLVYCIGENGLDLARRFEIKEIQILKTANWLGPLLVEGGHQGVESILLLGYHGKLIKLAGGIFHTHHHLADARLDIFVAHCGVLGLATSHLQALWNCQTTEDALQYLKALDQNTGSHWVQTIYQSIAQRIDQRTRAYIYTHSEKQVNVGTVLFGRDRQIICQSVIGQQLGKQVRAHFLCIDS
ncbi:MAG: cobalt-precorrin-5B (C(1))-methyltransferase CbiD [Cyanobacteria bacterium P01_F01_bin.150]